MFGTISVLTIVLILTLCLYLKKEKPPKIFNVYSQRGKWYLLKFTSFFLLLSARRTIIKLLRPVSAKELEEMKPLSDHEKAFDATFFQAVSQNGFYFCGGIERRHRAKANGLFYIAIPEMGLLESEKLPNTLLQADPASVLLLKDYGAEGISFVPVEPMKKWKVKFAGKMRIQNNPSKVVDVELNGDWSSDFPHFLSDTEMSAKCLAQAVARETWSRKYFQALKSAHQTHYEQMGHFRGTLRVDHKTFTLHMEAFRDHSFGYKRDWTLMHRYIFHILYLTDGTRISIGVVSQPSTTSHLLIGYVVLPDKSLRCIQTSDLLLYQHGEDGTPGTDYAFSFATIGKTYEAKLKVIYESLHFKGNNVEAKLIERFVKCEVNGMRGRGISEWHYNNLKTFK